MGCRLDRGPNCFLGFCSAIEVPLSRESNAMCCSNIMLIMLARGVEITLAAYFNNGWPVARQKLCVCETQLLWLRACWNFLLLAFKAVD